METPRRIRRRGWFLGGLILVATTMSTRADAVDLTGPWHVCADCEELVGCGLSGLDQFDAWNLTQTGSSLAITTFLGPVTATIDPMTGEFSAPVPPLGLDGVGTDHQLSGTFDATIRHGSFLGVRDCTVGGAAACDDGDACTVDTCTSFSALGSCEVGGEMAAPVDGCTYGVAPGCTTTTTTTPTTTTSTLPPSHHPVVGTKLLLRRSPSGKEKLVFTSKDPTLPFPAPGSLGDPTTATGYITLFTPAEGSSTQSIPAITGNPGWTATPASYKFVNASAPVGIATVRMLVLKGGSLLKVTAPNTGLVMSTPQGSVGVLVQLGPSPGPYTTFICAKFGGSSVAVDTPPVFSARQAPPPVNCYPATLSAP